MEEFDDIRPYRDAEIRPVLDQLIADPQFVDSIARFYAPRLSRFLPGITRRMAQKKLRQQLVGVHDVASMQDVVAGYMDKMIADTTTSLTHSGIDNLQAGRAYLFISNHRDITMDPAFVNYKLYHAGHRTLQIAIGDNLLKKPFVTDLMRLNKSFIVKRSLKGRELLQALAKLSRYIHYCIAEGDNAWIAQREGRAKDGVDRTDPALLKMLAMGRRDLPLGESLAQLHIVPVSLSYEYDACDVLKADELYQIETTGSYTKDDNTDINSIVTGMIGYKGGVHVAFGEELAPVSDDPDEIAAQIDGQILGSYHLHDTNYLALQELLARGELAGIELAEGAREKQVSPLSRQRFEERLAAVDAKLQRHLLLSYANPVIDRYGSKT